MANKVMLKALSESSGADSQNYVEKATTVAIDTCNCVITCDLKIPVKTGAFP